MRLRRPRRVGAALALLLPALLALPAPAQAVARRIVWQGVESWHRMSNHPGRLKPASGGVNRFKLDATVRFTYVQEIDDRGESRFISRRIKWTNKGLTEVTGISRTVCNDGDGVDLGPSKWVDQVPDTASDALHIDCETEDFIPHFGYFMGYPVPKNVSVISPPKIVPLEKLRDGCSYSEEDEREGYRYSVWVTTEFDAVVEVNNARGGPYASFEPEPGATIAFTAKVRPPIPATFKFEIKRDEVSRYPGYASNAPVDDRFHARFPSLEHLRGRYQNDDPDLIFDPANYQGNVWKQPPHGNAVETAKPGGPATALVTAMDYGAYGKLRAFAKAKCGGWQPAVFRIGGRRSDHVTISMDANGDLMADALSDYRGDPGADADNEPEGDRTDGDGLTTFEEYRGFIVKGSDCQRAETAEHVRTDPKHKTLFVHADDVLLLRMALMLRDTMKLDLFGVCARHYMDDDTRIVNFTLQQGGQRVWFGKTLSQDRPQHGLRLIDEALPGGKLGVSCGLRADCENPPGFGPPKNVSVIKVDKIKCLGRSSGGAPALARTIMHELGHAIGIHHHGDGNIWGPVVALKVPRCPAGTTEGTVDNWRACMTEFIAVRGAENSGDESCPMKYMNWHWYVPPGGTVTEGGRVNFRFGQRSRGTQLLPTFVFTRLKTYRKDLDHFGLSEYCTSATGTGINALPGDQNHAGDATRTPPCAQQIHINDVR